MTAAPQAAPMTIPMAAERKPISSALRPPTISSSSTSKPWLSVPSGCPMDGGTLVAVRSEVSPPW